jgi:hypothetical protein
MAHSGRLEQPRALQLALATLVAASSACNMKKAPERTVDPRMGQAVNEAGIGSYTAIVDVLRDSGLPHEGCEQGPWSEADRAHWRSSRAKDLENLPEERANSKMPLAQLARVSDVALVMEMKDRIMDKRITRGTRSLSDPQRTFWLVDQLYGEVNNGGFHQFFLNSSGNCALQTVQALKELESPLLDVYTKAIALFPASTPAEDRAVRNAQMSAIPNELGAWDPLNHVFFADGLDAGKYRGTNAALAGYIRAHQAMFDAPPVPGPNE